jgi:hypothetical protein
MTPLLLALSLLSALDTEAPDGLAPLPPLPTLADPDDSTPHFERPATGALPRIAPVSAGPNTNDATEFSSWRTTLVGEGAVPGALLWSLLGGGIGAGVMTVALVGLGVVFWGSLLFSGIGSLFAMAGLPFAFALLPMTATAVSLVPRLLGKKNGREFLDAGITFGLASAGTLIGAGLGVIGSIVVGGTIGVGWLFASEGSVNSLTRDPSSSFGLLYPIATTALVIPVGTLLGAATLGTGGAVLAVYASTFASEVE